MTEPKDQVKSELDRLYPPASLKEKDNEINKWMYNDILKLVSAFPKGYSGTSAYYLLNVTREVTMTEPTLREEKEVDILDWINSCFIPDIKDGKNVEVGKHHLRGMIKHNKKIALQEHKKDLELQRIELTYLMCPKCNCLVKGTSKLQEVLSNFEMFLEEELGAVLRGDIPMERKDSMLHDNNIRLHFDLVRDGCGISKKWTKMNYKGQRELK